ncbi:hydantoinase B/oxoprolinase family protein, partial [Spirulina sp. CCNP1310]|uniref:hydantoinase B/oxoprolinase family protein n=1 Tax=Spirulina sp. CCNP1310 TaxID=3110249 RepID=UPI002B204CDC
AAGGGSILRYEGGGYQVGPASAGANPGPAVYGRGGPLTITDCNVVVGKIQPAFFPQLFGPDGDQPLDREGVMEQFEAWRVAMGDRRSIAEMATGFLRVAIATMANAIKKISLERGYNVSDYTLCCFGGAGGQHACLLAEALGMQRVIIHPYAGVLSAYGIGLAERRVLRERAIEAELGQVFGELAGMAAALAVEAMQELPVGANLTQIATVQLKYSGTDSTLEIPLGDLAGMSAAFAAQHRQRYGFIMAERALMVEVLTVELITPGEIPPETVQPQRQGGEVQPVARVPLFVEDGWQEGPVFQREDLAAGDEIQGPALIVEATGTTVIEPGWWGEVNDYGHLVLAGSPLPPLKRGVQEQEGKDPVLLGVFNHLWRAIAEQMGTTLQNTSYSVNIKERLDFSCAIFDNAGQLVANAPHIPVHLGSMGASVASLIAAQGGQFQAGDVFALNNPYAGGTHLPDITVITPVFVTDSPKPAFFVASRGHHADIGGITPGSMPAYSTHIAEEGVMLNHVLLVHDGEFQEAAIREQLTAGPYPARNPDQNIADLQAQIAANAKGVQELQTLVTTYGLATVQAYMGYSQDQAEAAVRRAITTLKDGEFTCALDAGPVIQVKITIHPETRSATLNFTGTSPQGLHNFNAPLAVCQAVVLYVFRTLIDEDLPLNAGCLKPLNLIVPLGSLLNPTDPAAVVAGNVETSQAIADCLYGALGVLAASQGTMNNFTFGNGAVQYYETICGGSGAGPGFAGTDAVQTHMTNSRLTDPEVLEWRFPVRLEQFAIRPNSGGAGTWPGGNGVIRKIRFLEPMTAAILSGRRQVAPFGLAGGEPGAKGCNQVERADGSVEILSGQAMVEMAAGEAIALSTPGGGGYGQPKFLQPVQKQSDQF